MFLNKLNKIGNCVRTSTSPMKSIFKYQNMTLKPVSSASFGNRIKFDEDCGEAMPFYDQSQLNEMQNSEFAEETSNE